MLNWGCALALGCTIGVHSCSQAQVSLLTSQHNHFCAFKLLKKAVTDHGKWLRLTTLLIPIDTQVNTCHLKIPELLSWQRLSCGLTTYNVEFSKTGFCLTLVLSFAISVELYTDSPEVSFFTSFFLPYGYTQSNLECCLICISNLSHNRNDLIYLLFMTSKSQTQAEVGSLGIYVEVYFLLSPCTMYMCLNGLTEGQVISSIYFQGVKNF